VGLSAAEHLSAFVPAIRCKSSLPLAVTLSLSKGSCGLFASIGSLSAEEYN
jgi:hypothetical protein